MESGIAIDTKVFNLPRETIRRVVESAAGEAVTSYTVIADQEITGFRGYAAEKVLPRIEYTTRSGSTERITIFGKRMYGLDITEERQYAFLDRHGIPTPRRFGSARDPKNNEIIFFEHLEHIGIDEKDPIEARAYVSMLARLNSIRPRDGEPWTPPKHIVAKELTDGVLLRENLKRVCASAAKGELGPQLAEFCAENQDRFPGVVKISIEYGKCIESFPRALLHEDYAARNCGWRRGRSEFVIFDVHRLSIGPRFWDAAGVLGSPDKPSFECISWRELFDFYMTELARFGGSPGSQADYQREHDICHAAGAYSGPGWMLYRALTGEADWTPDREEGKRVFRSNLLRICGGSLR